MSFLDKIIHTVIPHEKHKNIPHILRKEFVGALSVLVVLLFFVNQNNFSLIRGLSLTGAIYPAVLADMTNEDRASGGLQKLAWNETLEKAADMKARDMIANSYFAHTSPRGISPWYWLSEANYDFIYAGENLALDFDESDEVQEAWLASPTHRANLLNQNYTEIGITAVDGIFEGRNTTFVVEFFGKPQVAKTNPATGQLATASQSAETTVKVIEETDRVNEKFISVQNTDQPEGVVESATETTYTTNTTQSDKYSTWYQRLAVNPTNAIKAVYSAIFALVLLAMLLVISKEYQKHHFGHLALGLMLMIITGVFLYSIKSPAIILAYF